MPLDALPQVEIPRKLRGLFKPARYKIAYGGRGGAKSWNFARALLIRAATVKTRILCAREYQSSIADSVHKLLVSQIAEMGLDQWFWIGRTSIYCATTGSEFIFKGLKHSVSGIRSTEAVDVVWIEEAQSVSEDSWQAVIPTIRAHGSEIWISFNPMEETDPTWKRFVLNTPPNSFVVKMNWDDNPWFPAELDAERRYMLRIDPDAYEHVWGGHCRQISEATIFRGRVRIDAFDPPEDARFFLGADWGFAQDPTVLLRCYVTGGSERSEQRLWVDHECYGVGVELDDTPTLFDRVPGARDWPIKADSSRPETISYIRRQGFAIAPAEKWQGCVEDGIAHLKAFREIVVHERCKHTAQEMRLYSYKTDPKTGDVLPKIVDAHNHCIDALRYSLDGYILRRGAIGIWERLAL